MPAVPESTLAPCSLFRGMTAAERECLVNLMIEESAAAGTAVIREGESTHNLWLILTGQCSVVKETKHGGTQELAVLGASSLFGEMSFFHPAPHSASVIAQTDVALLRLPRENYDLLLKECAGGGQKLALNTIAVLSERVRTMDNWTCELVERAEAGRHKDEWHEFRAKLYTALPF